jgi:zeaxanthin glucosyltransferase
MAHFGFLTLSMMGHLFPMSTLGLELQSRGHRVTFFCFEDAREFLQDAGLNTLVVGRQAFPLGYTKQVSDTLSQLSGAKGVAYSIETLCDQAIAQFAELPTAIKTAKVEALMIDQFAMSGGTVAEHLSLPYAHVAAALMANVENGVPPINVSFGPERGILSSVRNHVATVLVKRFFRPVRVALNKQRREWGLPMYTEFFNERLDSRPQICQEPPSFEFPRRNLPAAFHFVGPLHRHGTRSEMEFPWERLDNRPLIYASMGTLQNGMDWVFKMIAEGCAGLDVQLVLSLGGNLDPAKFSGLPGDPVVVQFAPQLELLERSSVCITHAGLNTALEALAHGVPMVAIPVTNDQPGVAARITWTGTGVMLGLKKLSSKSLRHALITVLTTQTYRKNAQRLQQEIKGLNSLQRACDIAETLIRQT